jgi:hypothetical protein
MARKSPSQNAKDYKNKIRKGNDDRYYISLPDENGIYKWKLITMKKTPEEFYGQFREIHKKYSINDIINKLNKIAKELRKYHIYIIRYSWSKIHDFSGEQMALIDKKLSKKYNVDEYHQDVYSFLTLDDNSIFHAEEVGELKIFHQMLPKHVNIIHDKLLEYFGKKLKWSSKKDIFIKLRKKMK